MRPLALVLLLASAAVAAPKAAFRPQENQAAPGAWLDLLLRVTPEAPIPLEGLAVTPKPVEGLEFGAAILPPPDADGAYAKEFVVRLPVRAGDDGKREVAVAVAGKGVDLTATTAYRALGRGHLSGEARLRSSPARAGEANAIVLRLSLLPEFHVYGVEGRDEGEPTAAALAPTGPKALWTGGGPVEAKGGKLHGTFEMEIPFTPLAPGRVSTRAVVDWSACTEQYCDPRESVSLPVEFEVTGEAVAAPAPAAAGASSAGGAASREDLEKAGLLSLALASVLAGLFALVMPCTYPMIPITISFFTKQAEARHGRTAPLAIAYGAGIVAIFAGLGAVVGLGLGAGDIGQFIATEWWINAIFAALFIVFGLSLLGLFEIRLPAFLDNVASRTSGTGGYLSVFAMGMTLVITSFTCTAPFVGSLLVWAARGGNTLPVVFAMAVFGATMAVPFVLLSLSPQALRKLPRSGEWMKHVKVTMGILELGLALKFISGMDFAFNTFLIGRGLFLVLWGLSFLAAAAYLMGLFGGFSAKPGAGRAVAIAALLGVTAYLGSGLGGRPLFKELEGFLPTLEDAYARSFAGVVVDDYEKGVALARERKLPIFLHFTGFQ